MQCIKCNEKIPSYALYCPYCGKKQNYTPKTKRKPGSIIRRNDKFVVYYKHKYIGTATTEDEAQQMVDSVLKGQDVINYTFDDCFQSYIKDKDKKWTDGTYYNTLKLYEKYFKFIKNKPMKNIKTYDLQCIIDECKDIMSYSHCNKLRILMNGVCKEAMKNDIINKNYASMLELPKNTKKDKPTFSNAQISQIWEHKSNINAQAILVLIYTGIRPNEFFNCKLENIHLDEQYLITGSKTEAGMNRVIPIADVIVPIMKNLVEQSKRTLFGGICSQDNFSKKVFAKTLKEIGIEPQAYTPYSCRHTFYTFARFEDVDKGLLIKVFGHSDESVGIENYYHPQIQEKLDMINRIAERV